MEADSDQRDNWERCNEASVGRALARQRNGQSGKNPAAIFLSLGFCGSFGLGHVKSLTSRFSLVRLLGGYCNKTGRWPALFLTFPLHLWQSLHYFTLLYITLHYVGHFSLLYSTCVRFMVAGGDLFVTPPLWHPASVAVRTLS